VWGTKCAPRVTLFFNEVQSPFLFFFSNSATVLDTNVRVPPDVKAKRGRDNARGNVAHAALAILEETVPEGGREG